MDGVGITLILTKGLNASSSIVTQITTCTPSDVNHGTVKTLGVKLTSEWTVISDIKILLRPRIPPLMLAKSK